MESKTSSLSPGKQIWAILPDDDHVTEVVRALKEEKNVLTAHQITCRGMGAVGRGVPGRRLRGRPPKSLRLLTVVVPEDQADDIFDFILENAEVDKPMGGIVFMGPLDGATAFTLPEGVQDEA
jgi:nitrogen regulatory protein PII